MPLLPFLQLVCCYPTIVAIELQLLEVMINSLGDESGNDVSTLRTWFDLTHIQLVVHYVKGIRKIKHSQSILLSNLNYFVINSFHNSVKFLLWSQFMRWQHLHCLVDVEIVG